MSDLKISLPLSPEIALARQVAEAPRPEVANPPVQAAADTSNQPDQNQSSSGDGGAKQHFMSPFSRIDYQSGLVVTEYRDTTTGELLQQFPNERVVREYRSHTPVPIVSRAQVQAKSAANAPSAPASTPAPSEPVHVQAEPAPAPKAPAAAPAAAKAR